MAAARKQQKTQLISTKEAADLLGKDVATVNRWARSGKLSPVYKGDGRTGVNLYSRREVQTLALQASIKAAARLATTAKCQ